MNKNKSDRGPLVEVRHSPVHGFGVFARRRIRKGTVIMEYLGERVTHEEADTRYEHKDANDNHTFLFTVNSKIVIDGGAGGNDARYINHGCEPNCESTAEKKRIFVEAVRTIQSGEELAYDYQIGRDPEDPPNVDEIFACRCGAAKCRGSMLVARKKPRKKSGRGPKVARGAGGRGSRASGLTRARLKSVQARAGRTDRAGRAAKKSSAKATGQPKRAARRPASRRAAAPAGRPVAGKSRRT